MKRLLLELADGSTSAVSIPDDTMFTFGPAIPFGPRGGPGPLMEYAVRVYQGKKENLVAVFPGVRTVILEGVVTVDTVTGPGGKVSFEDDRPGLLKFRQ